MRIERTGEGRTRIMGELQASVLRTLLDGANGGDLILDLSEVYAAEGAAVRLLSKLPLESSQLVGCPQWLTVWIDIERRLSPGEVPLPTTTAER